MGQISPFLDVLRVMHRGSELPHLGTVHVCNTIHDGFSLRVMWMSAGAE